MKSLIILIVICFGFTLTLSALHGTEITVGKEWWNENFYLKFNSPRGKTFFIDFNDGAIYRERNSTSTTFGELLPIYTPLQSEVTETQTELDVKKELPFISFVSIDLQIYDIYFDSDGIESQNPRLEKTEFVYQYKYVLIRTSLRSFVGPNKKVYQITYNDANEIDILETSPETLDHFRIKTFGPYKKWEHTYDFSENGELIVDHTISPIPVQADRSIPLLERDPSSIIEQNYIQTFVKFYTASGTKYHITNQLNIVPIRDDVKETAYITFTEPSGRTYDINIYEKDGSASLVEKSSNENYFGNQRLHSFVTPSGVLYRIDHRNESDHELPILVQDSEIFSELQITLAERNPYYNKFVKYIFSQNGKKLFDRVDEIDWTPLNEQPALPIEEATADYLMGNLPFLTLYTPSGNNYHVVTTDTNASIAVEKGATHSQNLYISYFQTSGRKTHIHFVPGTDPYLKEETESIGNEDEFSFLLLSFTTPDQKEYSIRDTIGDDNKWTPSIQLPTQVKEPIDLRPVDGLSITIQNAEGYRYVYRFTWNGDKLIEFSLEPPRYFADNKALRVLIGK